MPGLLNSTTNVTIDMLNDLVNITSPEQFFIKANHTIYNGVFFFVMLWVLYAILFLAAQKVKDQPLNNLMYGAAVCSVLSLVLRGITMVIDGRRVGMITDHQMWIFPIITLVLMGVIWSLKD